MSGAVPVSPISLNGMEKDNSTITFTRNSIYCQCILFQLEIDHGMKIISRP